VLVTVVGLVAIVGVMIYVRNMVIAVLTSILSVAVAVAVAVAILVMETAVILQEVVGVIVIVLIMVTVVLIMMITVMEVMEVGPPKPVVKETVVVRPMIVCVTACVWNMKIAVPITCKYVQIYTTLRNQVKEELVMDTVGILDRIMIVTVTVGVNIMVTAVMIMICSAVMNNLNPELVTDTVDPLVRTDTVTATTSVKNTMTVVLILMKCVNHGDLALTTTAPIVKA